jgi:hypothetical protein
MMSITSGHAKLKKAGKDLLAEWSATQSLWRDPKSEQFDERFIQLFVEKIRAADTALNHMEAVIQQVHKDCE